MVLTPATLLSPSQVAPMASQGISYDQMTEEEKTQVSFTDDSAQYAGATKKCIGATLHPLSGTSLKDSCKGKSS